MSSPAPRDGGAPPRVSWQDLFDAADSERVRAQAWADHATEKASASDQQSEAERETSRRCAASQRRRADVFKTMEILIARVAVDDGIKARLAEIARQEAADAAEREAEAGAKKEQGA